MATFLPACQILSGNSSQSLMVLIVPHFFSSPTFALWTPYFRLFCSPPQPHVYPTLPSSLPPPSPIPLSQLPVELATLQDLADGSVISSASLPSLFFSPFFSSLFFLCLIKLQNKTSVHLVLSFSYTVYCSGFRRMNLMLEWCDGSQLWFFSNKSAHPTMWSHLAVVNNKNYTHIIYFSEFLLAIFKCFSKVMGKIHCSQTVYNPVL